MTSVNLSNWLRPCSFALWPAMLAGCMSLPFGLGEKAETPRPADSMVIGVGATTLPDLEGPDAKVNAYLIQRAVPAPSTTCSR